MFLSCLVKKEHFVKLGSFLAQKENAIAWKLLKKISGCMWSQIDVNTSSFESLPGASHITRIYLHPSASLRIRIFMYGYTYYTLKKEKKKYS